MVLFRSQLLYCPLNLPNLSAENILKIPLHLVAYCAIYTFGITLIYPGSVAIVYYLLGMNLTPCSDKHKKTLIFQKFVDIFKNWQQNQFFELKIFQIDRRCLGDQRLPLAIFPFRLIFQNGGQNNF